MGTALWFFVGLEKSITAGEGHFYSPLLSCLCVVGSGWGGVGWNGSVVGGMMSRWVEMSQSRVYCRLELAGWDGMGWDRVGWDRTGAKRGGMRSEF